MSTTRAAAPSLDPLVGQYYQILKSGYVVEIGMVLAVLPSGLYYVQLYDVTNGKPLYRRTVGVWEMSSWRFYNSAGDFAPNTPVPQ